MDFPCFPMSVRVSSRFSSFFPTVACLSHLIFCGFHGQYIKMLSRLERSSMEGVEVTFCCLQMMFYWHHPEWTSNTRLKVLSSGENTCLSWRSLSTLRSNSQVMEKSMWICDGDMGIQFFDEAFCLLVSQCPYPHLYHE